MGASAIAICSTFRMKHAFLRCLRVGKKLVTAMDVCATAGAKASGLSRSAHILLNHCQLIGLGVRQTAVTWRDALSKAIASKLITLDHAIARRAR